VLNWKTCTGVAHKTMPMAQATMLVVGRQSGIALRYTLPHISLEGKYQLRCRPQRMDLNCNSTKLSIIDMNGVLTFFDLEVQFLFAEPVK
jgi:WD repeat-containing protein 35